MKISQTNPFILAHGSASGPNMHPIIAGTFSGAFGLAPTYLILKAFRTDESLSQAIAFPSLFVFLPYSFGSGALYGLIFRRAANDPRASWLFGMSSGFLFWMLGPGVITLFFKSLGPLDGTPALGVLLFQIMHGMTLGLLFPFIHQMLIKRRI